MGNCGSSLDCKQCYSRTGANGCSEEMDVDPDIAGKGVLAAFIVSAVITCVAIFGGYLTDSLPTCILTPVDASFIGRYQNTGIATTLFPWLNHCWSTCKLLVLRIIAPTRHGSSAYILTREQRQEAIVRLVLALSDQQLVTGIAIMAAAIANRCEITLHELNIVENLAFFSATTHLATLPILREYMYVHPIVRNWRLIGIYVFLVLLGFVQAANVLSRAQNPGKILQCVLFDPPPQWVLIYAIIKLTIYITIFWKYTKSALQFYSQPSVENNHYSPRVAVNESSNGSNKALKKSRFDFVDQYTSSFSSQIGLIVFVLTYGISKTVGTVWMDGPKPTRQIERMGFGQVVAIALIGLPLLTAAEIYNETRSITQATALHSVSSPTSGIINPIPEGTGVTAQTSSLSLSSQRLLSFDHQQADQEAATTSAVPLRLSSQIPIPQNSDRDPPELRPSLIGIFIFDLAFMLLAGIVMALYAPGSTSMSTAARKDEILMRLGAVVWVLWLCRMAFFANIKWNVKLLKSLWPRSGRKGQATVTAESGTPTASKDHTQSPGHGTPVSGTSRSPSLSNEVDPLRSTSSISLDTLDPPRRQDTEASVGLVPAPSL